VWRFARNEGIRNTVDEHPKVSRTDSGHSKLVIFGLLLLVGGGVAIGVLTRTPETPSRTPPPVTVRDAAVAPSTPLLAAPIELPPDEPDAAPAPPPDAAPPRIRYVTRYVDACPGTLTDPAGVDRVARANAGAVRACYERELRSDNTLRGHLTARLFINTSGRVENVQVSTSMNNRALVECVKSTLRRLTVPPSRGGCATRDLNYDFAPRE
jgi:hypothetical protein